MIGPNAGYLHSTGQGGAASAGHLLDLSLLGMAISASLTPIARPDFMEWTVASFGALLGGLIGARMFKAEGESLYTQWGISTASGIVFAPMLFEMLAHPGVGAHAAIVQPTSNALMGVSAATAIFSWGALRFVNQAWQRLAAHWLDQRAPRKARDEHEDGGP